MAVTSDNKFSIRELVTNPTGKGSAYVFSRASIRQQMSLEFIKLLRENRKAFLAIPYVYKNGDILYHVKVPSSDYKSNRIIYDVLYLLEYDAQKRPASRNIKLFSNSPSFIFSYCYVCNQMGLLVPLSKLRLPSVALNTPPEIRNPVGSLGFEKSTQMAAYFLLQSNALSEEYILRFGTEIDAIEELKLYKKIADPETIVEVYRHAKYLKAKKHKKPLSETEEQKRTRLNKQFAKETHRNLRDEIKTAKKKPKAKISPRKAKRNLLNNN